MKGKILNRAIALVLTGAMTLSGINFVPLKAEAAWSWSALFSKSGYEKITEGITVKADSEQRTGENEWHGFDDNAADGNTASYWHSNWGSATEDNPNVSFDSENGILSGNNTLTLSLETPQTVQGITYLPRQDDFGNGAISGCYAEIKTDGSESFEKAAGSDTVWEYVNTGNWNDSNESREEKEILFSEPMDQVKEVRLVVLHSDGSQPNQFISAAEIGLLKPTDDLEKNQLKETLSCLIEKVSAKLAANEGLYANAAEIQGKIAEAEALANGMETGADELRTAVSDMESTEYLFEDETGTGVYLSDLEWKSTDKLGSGYGNIAVDKHQGGTLPLTLRLDGEGDATTYKKGIGTHAKMQVTYDFKGKEYKKFTALVGVDASQGAERPSNLQFFVKNPEGTVLYDSGEVKANSPAKKVDVDVTGLTGLIIETNFVRDDSNGHGDWCDTRLYQSLKSAETYPITAAVAEECKDCGTASASAESACMGESVTFTAEPADGYEFTGWKDADGTIVSREEAYTLEVNGSVTLYACFKELPAGTRKYTNLNLDGTAPADVSEDAAFYNSMENFQMNMVYKFDNPQNKKYVLFSLGNGEGDYITVWHNPKVDATQGQLSVVYKGCTGLYWTRPLWLANDTNWHKLTLALTGKYMNIVLDGKGESQNDVNSVHAWFDYTNDFLTNHNWQVTEVLAGGKATGGIYANNYADMVNFTGTVKYLEVTSDAADQNAVMEKNKRIDPVLQAEFQAYLEQCNALEQSLYTADTWSVFEAARTAANAAAAEWTVWNTYEPLKAAREALVERGDNHPPAALENIDRTLVKGRTLVVLGSELASDGDQDPLIITAVSGNEKVNCTLTEGAAYLTCDEAGVTEMLRVTVSDGIDTAEAQLLIKGVDENLQLLYGEDLQKLKFDGSYTYKLPVKDARYISQMKDSLELSFTFRCNTEAEDKRFVKLMELTCTEENTSDLEDNAGGLYHPAKSTIALVVEPGTGAVYLHTGAYAGSTAWQGQSDKPMSDGKYHTLTVSVASDALRFKADGNELKTVTTDNDRMTKQFIQSFFGDNKGADFQDWRSKIDTITFGGWTPTSAIRHTNYANFKGELKSVLITDGGYLEEAFAQHHNSAAPKALEELTTLINSLNASDYEEGSWKEFIEGTAYTTAASMTENSTAREIYEAKDVLQTAIDALNGEIDFNSIGADISKMFDGGGENSWLFAGGAEAQGRFSEIAGVRNYIGQFEEYIRWVKAADTQLKRQRYTMNAGKAGQDITGFEQKLDHYITDLDPKAVSYLIGSEDYKKGEAGIDAFKTALTSVITKALAMKNNGGFAVIQLPHALKDQTASEQAELYVKAAKDVIRKLDSSLLSRVVLVDHWSQTDTDAFKNGNYLTEEGLLNAAGHYEIAKQLSKRTFGSTEGFPAVTNWTAKKIPESYLDKAPEVTAAASALTVTIPAGVTAAGWNYELKIDDMTISGKEKSNSFTISDLPGKAEYELLLISDDGKQQLRAVVGKVEAGNKGGEPALSSQQKKIRDAVDGDTPLTWLFMGDSITHAALWTNGYDGIAQNFEKYLKEDLERADDIVVNTAVSSADTKTTLDNIEQRLTKYKPDVVSIMIGTNDVTASGITAEVYEENLRTIVAKIKEIKKDAAIIFRTPTPTNTNRAGLLANYLPAMKRVAEDEQILLIDQYTNWDKEMRTFTYLWGNWYYFGDTNLHPGAQGQLRMAQQFIQECGLDTNKPIANLSYEFSYTDINSSLKPEITAGESTLAVSKSKLQEAYGQGAVGSIKVTLTDKQSGRTYTQETGLDGKEFVVKNLPTDRDYTVLVTAMMAGTAARVTFSEQDVTLAKGQEIPFQVLLSNMKIRDLAPGTEVGTLSVDEMAPAGDYSYALCSGESSDDNAKFEIENDNLKIKTRLEANRSYKIRVKAESGETSAETALVVSTMPTLEAVRKAAKDSFENDKMAMDLDLSGEVFDGTNYVDLGNSESGYYENGAYLKVLNNLREKTDGGTIIYRFRSTSQDAMVFGAGSSESADNKNMIYGIHGGVFRGVFRTQTSGLFADFAGASGLGDGTWHTVAMSFDTTKADHQNQILVSVDGSDNIFTNTSWWKDGWQSWFNVTGEEITNFGIGGGTYAGLGYGGGQVSLPALNGGVSFVTVTDDVYTAEELKVLSETKMAVISGEQRVSIEGDKVTLPAGALYSATDLTWNSDKTSAEFVLTPAADTVFDEENTVITVANAQELGFVNVKAEISTASVTVTLSKKNQDQEGLIFEREELTFNSGSAVYGNASIDSYVSSLKGMEQGSVTVRYKLTDTSITIPTAFFSVSNGTYTNGYTSFYIIPSTGAVGYEARTQNEGGSTNVNTGSIALASAGNKNWHTVTYVFDKNGTKMYFDGEQVVSNTNTGFLSSTEGVAFAKLGSAYRTSQNAKAYPFTGEMNLVQVTGKALSAAEVESLHEATAPEALELPDTAERQEDIKLFYSGYDGSVYYRIPTLFTTTKGTTIAGIDKRQSGSGDQGNIDTSIRRSTDSGKTWGDPQILFNQPAGQSQHSLTIDPSIVEDENGRLHLFVDLFPESQAAMNTGLLETGSGFKTVGDKQYPILRNYANMAANASGTWMKEYTIREDGVVWEENSSKEAVQTNYRVPNYLTAEGGGELFEIVGDQQVSRGNIYIYTGTNAGALKVPRVMNLVTCYSDDDGVTWKGYKNITGMVKKDWMLFLGLGPGVGICLKNQKEESLNGRLVVPVYSANSTWLSSQSSTFIYSDDNGETWEVAESPLEQVKKIDVSNGGFAGDILTEAQVVEMNDGTLQMFCRNNRGKVVICTGTALAEKDGAVKWSEIAATNAPDVYCQLSAVHYPEKVDGKEAVILSNPAGTGRNNGYIRVGLYQEDGSFEWKYGQLIKEGAYAYSCATILKNGNIGVLYEGENADTWFTSMNLEWLTAPRYTEFNRPVIENARMEKSGDTLTFTLTLDSYMMKKANPVLKLEVDGEEKEAAYVSGNASKEYVFIYDLAGSTPYTVKVINVGTAENDRDSFIEGVTGLLPVDVSFSFQVTEEPSESKELKAELQKLADLYANGKESYTQETWSVFDSAYKAAQEAADNGVRDTEALKQLLTALKIAHQGLKLLEDEAADQARAQLGSLLAQYKAVYEKEQSKYTEASWNVFAAAYTGAQNALNQGIRDLNVLSLLEKSLSDSYRNLELIQVQAVKPVKLAAPILKSVKSTAGSKMIGVKITVQKVAGADTYTVYRKNGNKIKKIGKADKNMVVYDTDPISGKTVKYYAVADSSNPNYVKSDAGVQKSMKLPAATGKVQAKQPGKKKQVRISWKKVKGAKGYVIYRSMKKASGYARIKVIKKGATLNFTDTKVKKGKTYYYKVVTRGAKNYSGAKKSKSVKVKK